MGPNRGKVATKSRIGKNEDRLLKYAYLQIIFRFASDLLILA